MLGFGWLTFASDFATRARHATSMDFSVDGRAPGKHPDVRIHAAGTVSPSSVRAVSPRLIFFRIEPLGVDSGVTPVEALVKYRDGCMDEDEIACLMRRLMSRPQVVTVLGFPEVTEDEPPSASLHVIQATLRHATADAAEGDDSAVTAVAASVSCSVEAAAGSVEGVPRELVHELTIPAVAREPLVEAPKTMTTKYKKSGNHLRPNTAARHQQFVSFLVETYGLEFLRSGSGVLDVAGGAGGVAFELAFRRGIPCVVVDPRPMRLNQKQRRALRNRANAAAVLGSAAGPPNASWWLGGDEVDGAGGGEADGAGGSEGGDEEGGGGAVDSAGGGEAGGGAGGVAGGGVVDGGEGGDGGDGGGGGRGGKEGGIEGGIEGGKEGGGGKDKAAAKAAAKAAKQAKFDAKKAKAAGGGGGGGGDGGGGVALQCGEAEEIAPEDEVHEPADWALAWEQEGLPRGNLPRQICSLFDETFARGPHAALFREASIVVGMHPDQATEPIVRAALRAGKPFAVVPCCVFKTHNTHRRLRDGSKVGSTEELCAYLEQLGQGGEEGGGEQGGDGSGGEEKGRGGAVDDSAAGGGGALFRRAELSTLFFEGKNTVVYSNSSPLGGGGETGDGAPPN